MKSTLQRYLRASTLIALGMETILMKPIAISVLLTSFALGRPTHAQVPPATFPGATFPGAVGTPIPRPTRVRQSPGQSPIIDPYSSHLSALLNRNNAPSRSTPPVVSPYINLARRGESPGLSYFGIVRPQVNFRNRIQRQQRELNQLIQGQAAARALESTSGQTGHATYFQNYSHYYPLGR